MLNMSALITGSVASGWAGIVKVIDVLPSLRADPMYAVSGKNVLTVLSAKYRISMRDMEAGRSVADMVCTHVRRWL